MITTSRDSPAALDARSSRAWIAGRRARSNEEKATGDARSDFRAADVGAGASQIASLDAQIAGQRSGAARFQPAFGNHAQAAYTTRQRAYYVQRKGKVERNYEPYDEQIAQNRRDP